MAGTAVPFRPSEIYEIILSLARETDQIYLVGGAVRDSIMGRPIHDIDLVMSGDVRTLAKKTADEFGGDFYMLDAERNTARTLIPQADGSRLVIDFALLRGEDLQQDLAARDFTANAAALDLRCPEQLIDPLNGAADIRSKTLRMCRPDAFQSDPLRILRGVRLALELQFRIEPATWEAMAAAVELLERVSHERQRDEIFRIFDARRAAGALRLLGRIGALEAVLPAFGPQQAEIASGSGWEHCLVRVQELEDLFSAFGLGERRETAQNFTRGSVVVAFQDFRTQIKQHFNTEISSGRTVRQLLYLAALLKELPASSSGIQTAEELAGAGRSLALSGLEIQRLQKILLNLEQIPHFRASGKELTPLEIYRFFRESGDAGVEICFLSLADYLAVSRSAISAADWQNQVGLCRRLLQAWWLEQAQLVAPPVLVTGSDLIELLEMSPGPQIGEALEMVRERQVCGECSNRAQALLLIQDWMAFHGNSMN